MDRGKPVIKALNNPPLIFGTDWKIYMLIVCVCVVFFLAISKLTSFLLLFLLSFAGKTVTKHDVQLPKLWALSFLQGGSYDPAKFSRGRSR